MTRSHPHNRFRLLAVLAITIGLALGSFWLLEVMRKSGDNALPAAARTDPDYYVEQFNFVRMSPTGEARYNISGAKLMHYPKDDVIEIDSPVLHSLSPDRPSSTMRSERAIVDQSNTRIQMIGNVQMERPASATTTRFQLKSEYMLIFPDEDRMRTDKPVNIVSGTTTLDGVGMSANNATGEFRVLSQTRGKFLPQPR
jgi:lipopolysaccharide export system protein LptC